ncbi:MAG: MFS transporter [Acetobacteraceae bacterium]|nr:MFS transporter [Acetobacteraceae bacterium]
MPTTGEAPAARTPAPWKELLRACPGFAWLWLAQTLSALGDRVHFVAFPWLFLDITGSPGRLSLMAVLNFLPVLLFGVASGVVIDRSSRRSVLVISNALSLALVGSVPAAYWLGRLSEVHLYLATFLAGTARVFAENGAQAYLPEIVPRPFLLRANSALQAGQSFATIAGPTLSGVLIAASGAAAGVALNAASFGVAAAIIAAIPVTAPAVLSRRPPMSSLKEGLVYLLRNRLVLNIAILLVAVNFATAPTSTLLFYRLKDELAFSPSISGLILSGGGAAALLGAVAARALGRADRWKTLLLLFGAIGAGLLLMGFTAAPLWTGLAWSLICLSVSIALVLISTLRQEIVPNELLGRVSAASRTLALLAVPVAVSLGGAASERFGSAAVFYGAGAIVALTAIAGSLTRNPWSSPGGEVSRWKT